MKQKSLLPTAAERLAQLKVTPFRDLLHADILDALLAKMEEDNSCEAKLRLSLGGKIHSLTLHADWMHEEKEGLSPDEERFLNDLVEKLGLKQ